MNLVRQANTTTWLSPRTGQAWELVIGLEVHCQLATRSKLFCGCAVEFGAAPNTRVCAVCSAQPGSLPVLNGEALRLAVRAGLALGCSIAARTHFDRKHYFYCDLPKGYQISQATRPFCTGGGVRLRSGKLVRLQRIHLEEDAGKAIHDRGPWTLVDLNRAGVPLIESVTEADLSAPEETVEYLTALKEMLQHAGVSACDMEKGELRCDVNVSVRKPGAGYGTKVEIKNLNSFRFVAAAIEYELQRQVAALESGDPAQRLVQETRLWDTEQGVTRSMRTKEGAADYRYMPEPDLPELQLPASFVERERSMLGEPPAERRARWQQQWHLAAKDAEALTHTRELADWFEAAVRAGAPPKECASFLLNEVLTAQPDSLSLLLPRQVAALVTMVAAGEVSHASARSVLRVTLAEGTEPEVVVQQQGLRMVLDTRQIEAWCRQALVGREAIIADVKAGKAAAVNALLGPALKLAAGKANAAVVRETLLRLIAES